VQNLSHGFKVDLHHSNVLLLSVQVGSGVFVMRIDGLDAFAKKIKRLEKVISELDGDLCEVTFDPEDPQSIDLAIKKMEADIERRVGSDIADDHISSIVDSIKEEFRAAIIERAAEHRAKGSLDERD
jgi:hypothetical protein